jgi:hypothetical protein
MTRTLTWLLVVGLYGPAQAREVRDSQSQLIVITNVTVIDVTAADSHGATCRRLFDWGLTCQQMR